MICGKSRSWYCRTLRLSSHSFSLFHNLPVSSGLNPQEDDAKFFEFSKGAENGSPRAGRLSKKFPVVPNEFRLSSGQQESRLIKFSCVTQGIHLVLQIVNVSQKLIHSRRILFLLHREPIEFQLSGFIRFLTANSSIAWQSFARPS